MAFNSQLRTDLILDKELLKKPDTVKIYAQTVFQGILDSAVPRQNTPGPAKDIIEVAAIIQQVIDDKESKMKITDDAKIKIFYNYPVADLEVEAISITITDRKPGLFERGSPGSAGIQNRKYTLRELIDDPDNPGYKRAVMGLWYDNTIKLTCWARTNKQALSRALWLENIMEEYSWYFAFSGVNRILFQKWHLEEVININNNVYFGRPLEYFVRTEKILNISQKTLEQIIIKNTVATVQST